MKLTIKFFLLRGGGSTCNFGQTLSADFASYSNSYLRSINATQQFTTIDELYQYFCVNGTGPGANDTNMQSTLCNNDRRNLNYTGDSTDMYAPLGAEYFAPRTCNQFWNPQVPISATNVDSFYLGMASQRAEREDFIITPDLRGKVFGALDFTRRDLMAQNLQRARDHGLPDFNSARMAYGLPPKVSFEDLNPQYGMDPATTDNIERLREVYNNDISK